MCLRATVCASVAVPSELEFSQLSVCPGPSFSLGLLLTLHPCQPFWLEVVLRGDGEGVQCHHQDDKPIEELGLHHIPALPTKHSVPTPPLTAGEMAKDQQSWARPRSLGCACRALPLPPFLPLELGALTQALQFIHSPGLIVASSTSHREPQLLSHTPCCTGHGRMLGAWSHSKHIAHLEELFASTTVKFLFAAPMFAPSPKHQSLSLCQKLGADQESLAQLGQQVRWWKPTCKQMVQSEHTYKKRIHLFMPSISYKLSVSDPPSSDGIIPRGNDITGFSWSPWEEHVGGTSTRSTPGRASPPEVNNPHQTVPSQGLSNQSLGRRL